MDTTPLSSLFEASLLFATLLYTSAIVDADFRSLIIAIGGSLAGAIMLGYFRRDSRKFEQIFKIIASAIGGLVLGTVLQTYFNIENESYRLGLFFGSSLCSLAVLRGVLNATERNATEVFKSLAQRALNLQTKDEKKGR